MKSARTKAPLVLMLVITLFAIIVSALSIRETNALKRGLADGFHLDGMYRDQETGLTSLAFLEEEDSRWQLVDNEGNTTDGSFSSTDDPNVYELIDQSGNEYGLIHLSYVTPDMDGGTLYLITGTAVLTFDKMEKIPAFYE